MDCGQESLDIIFIVPSCSNMHIMIYDEKILQHFKIILNFNLQNFYVAKILEILFLKMHLQQAALKS